MKAHRPLATASIFPLLVGTFVAMLLLTNVIVTKHIEVAGFVLTAGAITYPFTFSLLDIISEVYGPQRAKVVVLMGLLSSVLMTTLSQLVLQLPSIPNTHDAFPLILGLTPGIVLGSMIAYLTAQLIDIYLFTWVRQRTADKHLWLRNNFSTLVSQFVDTAIFGLIAWIVWPLLTLNQAVTPLSWTDWYHITVNEYAYKVVFTLLNTPLVYIGVYLVKRWDRT